MTNAISIEKFLKCFLDESIDRIIYDSEMDLELPETIPFSLSISESKAGKSRVVIIKTNLTNMHQLKRQASREGIRASWTISLDRVER